MALSIFSTRSARQSDWTSQSVIAHPTVNAVPARSISSWDPRTGTPVVHVNSVFPGASVADPVIAADYSGLSRSVGVVIIFENRLYADRRGCSGLEGFGRLRHRRGSGGITEEHDACNGAEDDGGGDRIAVSWV